MIWIPVSITLNSLDRKPMKQLTRIAAESDAGRRVKFLVRGDMGVSYHQFASLKVKGGLRVNGQPVHANHILRPGDVVPADTGKPFSAKYYTSYLTDKYGALYGI